MRGSASCALPRTDIVAIVLSPTREPRAWADRYIVSVSSGVVAGESLMGIVVIVMRDVAHWLPTG